VSNRGSLTISSPLAFAEGLFIFYEIILLKRRISNLKGRIYSKAIVIIILAFIYNKKAIQINNESKEG